MQDFGGEVSLYLSRADFDKLRSGEEEEESLEVGLKSWCIVKLDGVRPTGTCSLERFFCSHWHM